MGMTVLPELLRSRYDKRHCYQNVKTAEKLPVADNFGDSGSKEIKSPVVISMTPKDI
jgi:hypothetical protein